CTARSADEDPCGGYDAPGRGAGRGDLAGAREPRLRAAPRTDRLGRPQGRAPRRSVLPARVPGSGMTALLEARDVPKRYGNLAALNAVSFHVEEGEIVGLIGPNGAGKSTLVDVV